MDYEFFHEMTSDVAQAYLNRFLEVERESLTEVALLAAKDRVSFDYQMTTLPDCLKWFVRQVRTSWISLPADVPDWIRPAHPHGMLEFDDNSKTILLRAGYYLGECFARVPGLRWATGDVEYMEKNMPVVVGLRNNEVLPPLVVVENLFSKIARGDQPESHIDAVIQRWQCDLPESEKRH